MTKQGVEEEGRDMRADVDTNDTIDIGVQIEREYNRLRMSGIPDTSLLDTYQRHRIAYRDAVIDGIEGVENHYVRKEAAKRLLLERGVRIP